MYTDSQVRNILDSIGVRIIHETSDNFLVLCPFHHNNDSPAMSIHRTKGIFMCWNASCGESGNIEKLIKKVANKNEFQTQVLILRAAKGVRESAADIIHKLQDTPKVDFVEYDRELLDRLKENFWKYDEGRDYMHSRGFDDVTLEKFDIGYSVKRNMVTVPMHTDKGMPLGFIGRRASWTDKRFKNSKNLPTSKTLYNLHRAKGTADDLIIVEASFDAMRIDQAGFPNVCGSLGGYFNQTRAELVRRYFTGIIIMTDDDPIPPKKDCKQCRGKQCQGHHPGLDLGFKIAEHLPDVRIRWAHASTGSRRYYGFKDATSKVGEQVGMTNQQIRDCIINAVTHIEFSSRHHKASVV